MALYWYFDLNDKERILFVYNNQYSFSLKKVNLIKFLKKSWHIYEIWYIYLSYYDKNWKLNQWYFFLWFTIRIKFLHFFWLVFKTVQFFTLMKSKQIRLATNDSCLKITEKSRGLPLLPLVLCTCPWNVNVTSEKQNSTAAFILAEVKQAAFEWARGKSK